MAMSTHEVTKSILSRRRLNHRMTTTTWRRRDLYIGRPRYEDRPIRFRQQIAAHFNGFGKETAAPIPLEESATEIMTGFNSSFEALCQAQFDNMPFKPFGSTPG